MTAKQRCRVAVVSAGVLALATAVGLRLYALQLVQHGALEERARIQHERQIEVQPPRGLILDRNGLELAVSLETQSLFAHPHRVEQAERAAALLAPVLGESRSAIASRLRSDRPFVYIARFLEPEQVARVRRLDLPLGDSAPFGFLAEPKRYYPKGRLAVHVVGFASIDGVGLEGIERQFDAELRGDPSVYLVLQDGRSRGLRQLLRGPQRVPENIVLTLDLWLQHLVERELDLAMRETDAVAASAILLDPATGQILALANRPTLDANDFPKARAEERLNRVVVEQYEPGSTFKIVPMGAALEQGTVRPGQIFDCRNGSMRLGSRTIHDAKPNGLLSASQVMHKSSNIGMVQIARTLEPTTLWSVIDRFGFGRLTGVELPGERAGLLNPTERWNAYSYASLSFGQEISVTALQMAAAFGAVAQDGRLPAPRVVLGRMDGSGRLLPAQPPEPRQVLSPRTARVLAGMLEGVITHGTGKRARSEAYRLAGKSGTAQKVVAGRYSDTHYVASFGGFGPVNAPRLVGLVLLDEPRGARHTGGEVAAPVFGRIMADALAYLRVPPNQEVELAVGKRPSPTAEPDEARAQPALRERPALRGQVPELSGLTLREAVTRLAGLGYRTEIEGRGVVRAQNPPAGTPLAVGSTCNLLLDEPAPTVFLGESPAARRATRIGR